MLAPNFSPRDEDRVLRLKDAAQMLDVHPATLKNWSKRKDNPLTLIKLSPRRLGVRLSEIRAYIAKREQCQAALTDKRDAA